MNENKYNLKKIAIDSSFGAVASFVPFVGNIINNIRTGNQISKLEEKLIIDLNEFNEKLLAIDSKIKTSDFHEKCLESYVKNSIKNKIPKEILEEILLKLVSAKEMTTIEKIKINDYLSNITYDEFEEISNDLKEYKKIIFDKILIFSKETFGMTSIEYSFNSDRNEMKINYNKEKISEKDLLTKIKQIFGEGFMEFDDKWRRLEKLGILLKNNFPQIGNNMSTITYVHLTNIGAFFMLFLLNEIK